MIKSWSIKSTLQFWAAATVVVVLVMAVMANYANSLISSTQRTFADKQFPLKASSYELGNIADSLVTRQDQVLVTVSLSVLQQLPERIILEQDFEKNLQRISKEFDEAEDEAQLTKSIFNHYQDFLSLDDEIYSLKVESLQLAERLRPMQPGLRRKSRG